MKNVKRRTGFLFVMLCVLALVFTACNRGSSSAERSGEKIKIGISISSIDSTFVEGLRDGMVKKVRELGGEPVVVVADGDATLQGTQIEGLVAQGCKAVVCFAQDTDAITASAQYCDRNGVIFVEASRISPDMTYVDLALGFDNKQQAEICGQAILDGAKNLGYTELKCIEFIGSLTDQNAIERQKFFETFADNNNIKIAGKVLTEWNAELGLNRYKDAITACNNDYNCIYSASDFLFTPIMSVLMENGQWVKQGEKGYIIITGIDGAPDAIQKIKDGYVYMVANTDVLKLGSEAAEKAWDMAVNGTTYAGTQKMIIVDAQTITAENANDPGIWGNVY